jgi:Restriction endonuclease AspBHI N-terminal/Restriction endonuclease
MGLIRVGQTYRYARPYAESPEIIDGLPNFFAAVRTSGADTKPVLEAGINALKLIKAVDGQRRPAILISSSPHKAGSEWTPWDDTFEQDVGFVRYFGDNRDQGKEPSRARGNALLLAQFPIHTTLDSRRRESAVPIFLFRRVAVDGRQKGNVMFAGLAVLERAELVTQFDQARRQTFTNYAFEFAVLGLPDRQDSVDWDWISARRDPHASLNATADLAPKAWKLWMSGGPSSLPRLRRHVLKSRVVPVGDQCPGPNEARIAETLETIYRFYDGRKSRFEALASRVTAFILERSGAVYREGWVTPEGADHGTDFVGRLTIGSGFASTKVVLLGQAKCERPDSPTGGVHIARTVARLRRGWIGAYVTTSYFSERVQREVLEDQYPILLIHGLELATAVQTLVRETAAKSVEDFLAELDISYESMISARRPEEILFD